MARAMTPKASARAEAGRLRRVSKSLEKEAKIEWFIREVSNKVKRTMKQRVRMATELVHAKVVRNISRPVTKGTGPRGGRVVTDRSVKGEYPKADTTLLMKGIFKDFGNERDGVYSGYVGTPLSYGLILETKMNRSFLKRTLNEKRSKVMKILSGPIK